MHYALDVYEHWPPSDTNAETDTDTDTVRHQQERGHGYCAVWWKRILIAIYWLFIVSFDVILQRTGHWNSKIGLYTYMNKKLNTRWDSERELSLQRGKTTIFDLWLAVRFGSLSYDDIVHAVQNTIDSCTNSATDRRGHSAHLYRRPNPTLTLTVTLTQR